MVPTPGMAGWLKRGGRDRTDAVDEDGGGQGGGEALQLVQVVDVQARVRGRPRQVDERHRRLFASGGDELVRFMKIFLADHRFSSIWTKNKAISLVDIEFRGKGFFLAVVEKS